MLVKRIGKDKQFNLVSDIIVVEIGSKKFTITESIDGILSINKTNYDPEKRDGMRICPCVSNVIEID